nr:MAG TPA: hypothetical protein [Caudoviricetes sp.]
METPNVKTRAIMSQAIAKSMEGATTNAWSRSAIAPAVKRHERGTTTKNPNKNTRMMRHRSFNRSMAPNSGL